MKEVYIKDLRKDSEVIDFFMVKATAIKTGSNGKQYWDLTLGDKYGEVTAKKWDITDKEIESILTIKEKDIVKVKALITEWAGQLQMRVMRIRPANENDEIDMQDYVKAAPEDPHKMYD